jgi:dTDP-4-amino-4,6-dideoxygalactose transaminase
MSDNKREQQLALQGGMKAISGIEGKGRPKIGMAEFMSLAERFGFSKEALRRIREAVSEADMPEGGPFLANYYSGLKESKVQAFERVARKVFGVKYALAVSSGTAALHAAFVAAGVGPGTEVVCPALGFYATAAAVVMARGVPVFCDIDDSLGMDPAALEKAISPRTVAVAPTHVMGSVCDMAGIMRVARKHKIKVVEDCAQSAGGKFHGKYVGTIGDLGCFSISSYKIVGGGEGGLIVTNNQRLYERACCLVEGGGLWRPERFAPPRYRGELFVGTNYRMSELEAAVDVVQLGKLPGVAERFRRVKQRITREVQPFREITGQRLNDPEGEVGYLLRFYPESLALGRKIVEALQAEGVACGRRGDQAGPDWHMAAYMFPLLLQAGGPESGCPFDCPRYQEAGGRAEYQRGDCPVAEDLFDRMISINLNQWYTAGDCRNLAKAINKVLAAYCTAA